MNKFPPDGLIVSCYLEGLAGAERDFISAVAHVPGVVGLRVEGLDNIDFARRIAPDAYIIGLIKEYNGERNIITPHTVRQGKEIIHAGADIVATEMVGIGFQLPPKVMWDMHSHHVDWVLDDPEANRWLKQLIVRDKIILATTFMQKAFTETMKLRNGFPVAKINLEGGIETHKEVTYGLRPCGANYVTIGKAINDPETIITNLLKGKADA